MDIIVITLLSSSILIGLYEIISHVPIFPITSQQRADIKQNGLLHFTENSKYESIRKEGLYGFKSSMGFPETLLGEMVWMYSGSCNIEEKHLHLLKTAKAKANNSQYGICIHITNIPDEYLSKMFTRKSFKTDSAIVYRGKHISNCHYELIKKW